jgi:NIMA (never in mitosis gene a)-related kinase
MVILFLIYFYLCSIVMDFADDGDLLQKVKRRIQPKQPMEEIEIWNIAIQMVKGIKALHDKGILHRDLKSANIFTYSDGSVRIGDLNVSKIMKE